MHWMDWFFLFFPLFVLLNVIIFRHHWLTHFVLFHFIEIIEVIFLLLMLMLLLIFLLFVHWCLCWWLFVLVLLHFWLLFLIFFLLNRCMQKFDHNLLFYERLIKASKRYFWRLLLDKVDVLLGKRFLFLFIQLSTLWRVFFMLEQLFVFFLFIITILDIPVLLQLLFLWLWL
jgi:hypothetical protein